MVHVTPVYPKDMPELCDNRAAQTAFAPTVYHTVLSHGELVARRRSEVGKGRRVKLDAIKWKQDVFMPQPLVETATGEPSGGLTITHYYTRGDESHPHWKPLTAAAAWGVQRRCRSTQGQ